MIDAPRAQLWWHSLKAEAEVLGRRLGWVEWDYDDRDRAYRCETGTRRVSILFYRFPQIIGGKPYRIGDQLMSRFRNRFRQVDPAGHVELASQHVDRLDCSTVVPTGQGRQASIVIVPTDAAAPSERPLHAGVVHFRALAFADRPDSKICPVGAAERHRPIDVTSLVDSPLTSAWAGAYRLISTSKGVLIDQSGSQGGAMPGGLDWWAAATFAGDCYWFPGGDDLWSAFGSLPSNKVQPRRVIHD